MTAFVTFALIGLGAGAAYAAIALGLVVTYKGTGVINFAAGAMAAWAAFVFDELRRSGNLLLPIPINHKSELGGGSYGGLPLWLLAAASAALLFLLINVLVARPVARRRPELGRAMLGVGAAASLAWGVVVFGKLHGDGDYYLPLVPFSFDTGTMAFVPALLTATAVAAVLGLAVHVLIFRPLRTAPPLAKVVASVGLMITIQALIVFRFGNVTRTVQPIFPNEVVRLGGGVEVGRDRLYLALAAVVIGLLLWAYFRYTSLGLATRAAAESERNAALGGSSPEALAATTWIISSAFTGFLIILTLPIIPLTPSVHTLMIVPALACALVGRLSFIGRTVAAALVLGAVQSIFTLYSTKTWWPDWAVSGLGDAVPFVVLIVVLFILGKSLPTRGSLQSDPLPEVVMPKNRLVVIGPLVAAGAVLLLVTSGGYRYGLITSMILSIAMLSIVLLTGLIGQISLAQAAIAGTAGFALSKFASNAGIGFPWSMLLAALVAAGFGMVVGVPALRIRGAQLAVVTLAASVALERFVFRNPKLSESTGNVIPNVKLFGMDLAVRKGSNVARWQFGMLVLVILVVTALAVANIIRSGTGRRFLAVRSNERAGAAVGINVAANKLLAFGIASFFAGIAGCLIGYSRGQLSADSFGAFVNISYLVFAYLGGITSIAGALVAGALAPLGIAFVISDRLVSVGTIYTLVAGISLILTAIFNPIGVAGAMRENVRLLMKRRRGRAELAVAPAVDGAAIESTESTRSRPASVLPVSREDRNLRLRTVALTVRYGGIVAVDSVSLDVREGEIVGLIGPNGAGKTSFMDGLTGFTAATGAVEFGGQRLETLPAHTRARNGMTRTWQSVELFSDLTVRDNLRVACERVSWRSVVLDVVNPTRRVDSSQVDWALDLLSLSASAHHKPDNLSLGQQKLLGVARAIVSRPAVVLLDEPAAGLDSSESLALGERLRDIAAHGTSVLLIDHDMGLVLDTCDYIYVLEFGKVIAEGVPSAIRTNEVVIEAYLGESAAAGAAGVTGEAP